MKSYFVSNMSNPSGKVWITSFDPIKILQVHSEDDYESIIEDWQRSYLGKKFVRVEQLGGPRDKGRDILCTDNLGNQYIYQCKHYGRKLNKSEALLEIGKLCYYCFKGDYQVPKKYYFVSPLGVTTYVRDMLSDPIKLKKELVENWNKTCRSKITSTKKIELEGKFREYITQMDLSIFDYVSPKDFILDFKTTSYYTKWFGNLVKARELVPEPPDKRAHELIYIKKILEAYSDYLGKNIDDENILIDTEPDLWDHFKRQRYYFFSAEYLAAFSRDTYPPEDRNFENLKDEMYHGIIDEIHNDAKNGFERLRKVLQRSTQLMLSTDNPLTSVVNAMDRQGLPHHLANEREDVKWTK